MKGRPLVVLLAALAGVALTARLGWWQLDRAAQKRALQAAWDERAHLPELAPTALATRAQDAASQYYRRVRLQGRWRQEATVFLDNRQMNGRVGFFVVTPLLLEANDAVLVQRGWVPRNAQERTALPAVPTPAGLIEVSGQIAAAPGRLFDFGGGNRSAIRQNLVLADYAHELGLPLRPLSVLQADATDTLGDGLSRQWPHPDVDVHRHDGYAFQWFALCALIAGLYVWFQLIKPWRAGRAV